MTAAEDAKKTVHELRGLEADNLLAFLALLGLLRALEKSRPEWQSKVYWEGRPPKALLICDPPKQGSEALPDHQQDVHANMCNRTQISSYDLIEALIEAMGLYHKAFKSIENKTGLVPSSSKNVANSKGKKRIPETERITFFRNIAQKASSITRNVERFIALDAIAAFARQGIDNYEYYVEDSPLKLPSGQQAFIGSMIELFKGEPDTAKTFERTLFSSWHYEDKGDSLRLSPQEDKRYAYRYNNPSPEGARTERGANILAAIGLTCIPLSPGKTKHPLVAYKGERTNGCFTWPIWKRSASLAGILSLMRHPELVTEKPRLERLKPYGVVSLMRCRRYTLPTGQGDYGNVSRSTPIL